MKKKSFAFSVLVVAGFAMPSVACAREVDGTVHNPRFRYTPSDFPVAKLNGVLLNEGKGSMDGESYLNTGIETSSNVSYSAKLCEPLFAGPNGGHVTSSIHLLAKLTPEGAAQPNGWVLQVLLSAIDPESGQKMVWGENLTPQHFIQGQWFVVSNRLNLPAKAKEVCISVFGFPVFLPPGERNPFIESLRIGNAEISMHFNN
jgi:hypothetical protein